MLDSETGADDVPPTFWVRYPALGGVPIHFSIPDFQVQMKLIISLTVPSPSLMEAVTATNQTEGNRIFQGWVWKLALVLWCFTTSVNLSNIFELPASTCCSLQLRYGYSSFRLLLPASFSVKACFHSAENECRRDTSNFQPHRRGVLVRVL